MISRKSHREKLASITRTVLDRSYWDGTARPAYLAELCRGIEPVGMSSLGRRYTVNLGKMVDARARALRLKQGYYIPPCIYRVVADSSPGISERRMAVWVRESDYRTTGKWLAKTATEGS